jgi:hypothetical protein
MRRKLTDEQLEKIKQLASEGVKPKYLAQRFGVSYWLINKILRGDTYANR